MIFKQVGRTEQCSLSSLKVHSVTLKHEWVQSLRLKVLKLMLDQRLPYQTRLTKLAEASQVIGLLILLHEGQGLRLEVEELLRDRILKTHSWRLEFDHDIVQFLLLCCLELLLE